VKVVKVEVKIGRVCVEREGLLSKKREEGSGEKGKTKPEVCPLYAIPKRGLIDLDCRISFRLHPHFASCVPKFLPNLEFL
jgi:hypothetical protein